MLKKKSWIVLLLFIAVTLSAQFELTANFYTVSVTGAVINPGVYRLPPASRVSEAIKMAGISFQGSITPDLNPAEFQNNQLLIDQKTNSENPISNIDEGTIKSSSRNIELRRDGRTVLLDLEKFYLLGDTEQNPYIQDGDVIHVSFLMKQISIMGAVNKSGNIEILDGERVSDVIELAGGLTEDADLEMANLNRYDGDLELTTIDLDLNRILSDPDSEANLFVSNRDRIYIRSIPEFFIEETIIVSGEIYYPGRYPLDKFKTTLSDLIESAGGTTENADLRNALLLRQGENPEPDLELERLLLIPPSEMKYLEYEYLKSSLRERKNKVVVDFEKLIIDDDKKEDKILKNGDVIYFPSQILTVKVRGFVEHPGEYTYLPEMNYQYYIERAGGFSYHAKKNKIRIIRGNSGEWVKPGKDIIIYAGDIILVPEKPEKNYWTLSKEVLTVLSQLATLFLIYQNATTN
ncbi:MAG: SLBB domain-containing protein [Candidatus Cloacimonetes bacterium]|nr:SLBB domain-containing protein [Candidatus Cloacimonadota bacterium]